MDVPQIYARRRLLSGLHPCQLPLTDGTGKDRSLHVQAPHLSALPPPPSISGSVDSKRYPRPADLHRSQRLLSRLQSFQLGGAVISWSSKRQNTIALFSCKAEYIVALEAVKEDFWMRHLLNKLDYEGPQQATTRADNKSAIALAESPMHQGRTKHIEIWYHFIGEKLVEGLVKLVYVSTKEEAADSVTKPLAGEVFVKFIRDLGLEAA